MSFSERKTLSQKGEGKNRELLNAFFYCVNDFSSQYQVPKNDLRNHTHYVLKANFYQYEPGLSMGIACY